MRTREITGKKILSHRRRASTLVEFALLLPVLMIIIMGIIEFGWFSKTQLTIANAAREGARSASLGKTQDEIKTRVINAAKPITLTTSNITLLQSEDNGATYTAFPADNNSTDPAQNGVSRPSLVKVRVEVPHTPLTNFPGIKQIFTKTISVEVVMVRE
jgi:Flp pilus assembly protein TadG